MKAALRNIRVAAGEGAIVINLTLENRSGRTWTPDRIFLGWQLFDPATNRFISDGAWTPLPAPLVARASVELEVRIAFPPEHGSYHIYVSPVEQDGGWLYTQGEKFLLISADVRGAQVSVADWELTSTLQIRMRNLKRIAPELLLNPVAAIWRNRRLVRSMVRRDILARYRGSFGGALWAVLNPLLLMSTYFFVFGVVLRQRFGNDSSGSGYVLYLLAGMIPWLAVNEAIARSPYTILEYRTFVRKLVFPLETLNAIQVASSLVTEMVALAIFLAGLLLVRGSVPLSILWLPVLIVPQVLFTLGVCWFLAALGVFARDLGQVIGFAMTIWFFLTPICYAEEGIPRQAAGLLTKNPMYFLVHAYRGVLLKGESPEWRSFLIFTALAACVFLLGHAWFFKLRRNFADVV